MAQAQATYAPLATVEAASYASPKLDEKRTDCSTCSAIRKQRARPVVERERLAHESGVPQILVRSTRLDLASGHPAAPSRCIMNRRMRNRTSGGVGGRRGQPRLLPDCLEPIGLGFSFARQAPLNSGVPCPCGGGDFDLHGAARVGVAAIDAGFEYQRAAFDTQTPATAGSGS